MCRKICIVWLSVLSFSMLPYFFTDVFHVNFCRSVFNYWDFFLFILQYSFSCSLAPCFFFYLVCVHAYSFLMWFNTFILFLLTVLLTLYFFNCTPTDPDNQGYCITGECIVVTSVNLCCCFFCTPDTTNITRIHME